MGESSSLVKYMAAYASAPPPPLQHRNRASSYLLINPRSQSHSLRLRETSLARDPLRGRRDHPAASPALLPQASDPQLLLLLGTPRTAGRSGTHYRIRLVKLGEKP